MKATAPKAKTATLAWYGWTDRGRVRPNNEDSFLGLRFDRQELQRLGKFGESAFSKMDFAFAVSDGVGGSKAGEYASKIAVEKMMTLLPWGWEPLMKNKEKVALATLTNLYVQAHKALRFIGSSYEECAGMEATLSVAWFSPRKLFFAHIGDTRIYHLSSTTNTLRQVSEDDTHVAWLLRNGQISETEAQYHPGRKILQKALGGTHQFVDPQLGSVSYSKGDIFLLCSDGLMEGLDERKLAESLSEAVNGKDKENPAQVIVQNSLATNGSDNITALIIQAM